jgi:hypothetical protein
MRLPFGARTRFALFGLGALGGSALSAGPALAPVGRPPLASRPRVGQQPAAGEEPHGVLARASVALRCGGAPKNQCQYPFRKRRPTLPEVEVKEKNGASSFLCGSNSKNPSVAKKLFVTFCTAMHSVYRYVI